MRKIIYFDEGSVTDLLLIEHGGQITSIDEEKGSINVKGEASVEGKAGASTGFLNIVKASFQSKMSANVNRSKDTIISRTVTNTILTDFINLEENLVRKNSIQILKGYKVRALKDSFAYMKIYSPYMKLFKEDSAMVSELQDLDLHNVDDILTTSKGYYEMLGYKADEEIILRFNINEFRNAYTLTDLPKMKLTFVAVEVGECLKSELSMNNELAGEIPLVQQSLNIEALMRDEEEVMVEDSNVLKIYDVVLAGIGDLEDEN